jgi:hypothetical protein
MVTGNCWLRRALFALVTARRRAVLARELADPVEPCRTAREFPAGAAARARHPVDPDRDRRARLHGVCTPFGLDLRTSAIRRESLGCRQ